MADERKAEDILVLDMRRIFALADYFVIVSGLHAKHLQAVSDAIAERLRAVPGAPRRRGREGYDSGVWLLIDYDDVVVHAFHKDHREYYELERLWGDAKEVAWKVRGRALLKKHPLPVKPVPAEASTTPAASPPDEKEAAAEAAAPPEPGTLRPRNRRGVRVRLARPSTGPA